MKKLFILFSFCAIFVSCAEQPKRKVEKPFLVIDKVHSNNSTSTYLIQDNNGETWWISDERHAYKVGDTIR